MRCTWTLVAASLLYVDGSDRGPAQGIECSGEDGSWALEVTGSLVGEEEEGALSVEFLAHAIAEVDLFGVCSGPSINASYIYIQSHGGAINLIYIYIYIPADLRGR